jgi:Polyketide cyclase / dehydrase and lipid transport
MKQVQSVATVLVNAPLSKVWDFNMDITKLEQYHPRTDVVTYLSGKTIREVGVEYQCNILDGEEKGSCVERITEVTPMKQFTTTLPSDTWGLSDLFENIEAVTLFEVTGPDTTRMSIEISFDAVSSEALNMLPLAKEKFKIQTRETLEAIKKMIEHENNSVK